MAEKGTCLPSRADRLTGCLLAGAVGDALGAPVEFSRLREIRRRFGPSGIRDFAPAYGRYGAITDDTQMTLFTAEGLIRAKNRMHERGTTMPLTLLHRAYLRWLVTQGEEPATSGFAFPPGSRIDLNPGWLSGVPSLHSRRGPGNTCLTALRQDRAGTIETPINDSKGCGGVMRVAPVGLAYADDPSFAFELAAGAAAITHGHPSGYLSAGALALMISIIVQGGALPAAIDKAQAELTRHPNHAETSDALAQAVGLAATGAPSAETLERLGGGWVGEEALAIAVYAALSADTLEDALILAVNHSGDSDSTGAVAGNLLGALHGPTAIPPRWLDRLELRVEIEAIARDLQDHFHDASFEPAEEDFARYPPN